MHYILTIANCFKKRCAIVRINIIVFSKVFYRKQIVEKQSDLFAYHVSNWIENKETINQLGMLCYCSKQKRYKRW